MARDRRLEGLENIDIMLPENTSGKYDFPIIAPVYELPTIEKWLDLQEFREMCKKNADLSKCGLQLYNWDYKIQCFWNNPQAYIERLKKLAVVCAPDFSLYADTPAALQMFNHYKHNWLAAYWQLQGITVIPSLSWSTPESYEWCFDGLPRNSIVSISAQGIRRNTEQAKELFRRGYFEAVERLSPSKIICYGKPFEFMKIDERIKSVGDKFNLTNRN